MPNTPFYGYQNSYNSPNPNILSVYLEIQNKTQELEKKIKELEYRINLIESQKSNNSFEYQTSMNMM